MKIMDLGDNMELRLTDGGIWESEGAPSVAEALNSSIEVDMMQWGPADGDPLTLLFHYVAKVLRAKIIRDDPPPGLSGRVY